MLKGAKRKVLLLGTLLVLIAAGSFVLFSGPQTQIVGNDLSRQDVVEIKRLLYVQIWRSTFSKPSTKAFRGLPSAILRNTRSHVTSIEAKPDGTVQARIVIGRRENDSSLPTYYYELKKVERGWQCSLQGEWVGWP